MFSWEVPALLAVSGVVGLAGAVNQNTREARREANRAHHAQRRAEAELAWKARRAAREAARATRQAARGSPSVNPDREQTVTLQHAVCPTQTYLIPPPTPAPATPVVPNEKTSAGCAWLEDTARLAALWEPLEIDNEASSTASALDDGALTLSASHLRLLAILIERDVWTKQDLTIQARICGLMPDGAIEALNDWSLDTHGRPLIEGEQRLSINGALARASTGMPA